MKQFAVVMLLASLAVGIYEIPALYGAQSQHQVKLVQRAHAVSFHEPQGLPRMAIEVFSLRGERVFYGLSDGNGIMWNLRDQEGRKVPNGIYFYRMTSVDFGGSYHWGTLKKFIVVR